MSIWAIFFSSVCQSEITVLQPFCYTGSNEIHIQKISLKIIFNSFVNGAQVRRMCLGSRLWSSGFFMVG